MTYRYNPAKLTPELIKATRAKVLRTQAEFASALGVSHITVSRWECGARISAKNKRKLYAFIDKFYPEGLEL